MFAQRNAACHPAPQHSSEMRRLRRRRAPPASAFRTRCAHYVSRIRHTKPFAATTSRSASGTMYEER